MIVTDTQNNRNVHTIKVEVTQIVALRWLEDHIEVKKNEEDALLNLIAFDREGRKFTNCTSVDATFDLKGAGILQPVFRQKSFDAIHGYTAENVNILDLKQRFEMTPSANFGTELK